MEFTASYGEVISENRVLKTLSANIKILKKDYCVFILCWEREFLEWFLNKNIEPKMDEDFEGHYIVLHEDVTEEDLEQLEQLRDYLEL